MARFKIFFGQVPTGAPPVILYQRPDGDVALDGWTDHADGTSDIFQSLDETSASDSDYVQSPEVAVDEGGTITIGTPPGVAVGLGTISEDKSAQNFISVGSSISSIRLWLRKEGSPVDGVQVKIYTADASHHPATQVGVTSDTITGASLATTLTSYDFMFLPAIAVTNAAEYCFVLERTGTASASDFYQFGYADSNPYPNGQLHYFSGGAWLSDLSSAEIVSVVDQTEISSTDFKVRLFEGSTQIVEWTHTDIADTFTDATQTLTTPQYEAIGNFANLFAELDDNQGSVYRFALGDPSGGVAEPVRVKYRYKVG